MTWQHVAFDDLPPVPRATRERGVWTAPGGRPVTVDHAYRFAGTTLMDREQYDAEGWVTDGTYWRPGSMDGLTTYLVTRRQRMRARHDEWWARTEADEQAWHARMEGEGS